MIKIRNRFNANILLEIESLLHADLRGAILLRADLLHADLREADLLHADLRGADLRGANLREADLLHADLRGADLRGADLRGANLRGADLCGANLREADLRGQNITLIQGTKHFLQHYDNMIRIECKYYTVPEWIKNYKDVGKKYEYTDTEIEEYGRYIKMIAGKCNIEV